MKLIKLSLAATLLAFSVNANSALIDNGLYTTDDVSGLDWLDLTVTDSQAYNSVEALNPGWRHATNSEVENIFSTLFDGYYSNLSNGGSSSSSGAYADQYEDTINFMSLFGITGTFNDNGYITEYSWGAYLDENNILRQMGARLSTWSGATTLSGIDPTLDIGSIINTGNSYYGTYMVRASVVPVPAAVWLFASGLIGLVSLAKRQS